MFYKSFWNEFHLCIFRECSIKVQCDFASWSLISCWPGRETLRPFPSSPHCWVLLQWHGHFPNLMAAPTQIHCWALPPAQPVAGNPINAEILTLEYILAREGQGNGQWDDSEPPCTWFLRMSQWVWVPVSYTSNLFTRTLSFSFLPLCFHSPNLPTWHLTESPNLQFLEHLLHVVPRTVNLSSLPLRCVCISYVCIHMIYTYIKRMYIYVQTSHISMYHNMYICMHILHIYT
jgi:hypothetical protein